MTRCPVLWCVIGAMAGGQLLAIPAPGRVSGVVMTTDEVPTSVRRAIVSMWGGPHELGHHAITDDQGRFDIPDVPPGRYTLSAARPSYITIEYGAVRPGWPGTPLSIKAGEHIQGVRVRLVRAAVIEGTVRSVSGDPVVNAEVRLRLRTSQSLQVTMARAARTDDRGMYRAHGLTPGAWMVSVQPPQAGTQDLLVRSEAEVDAILHQLRLRTGAPVMPSGGSPVTALASGDVASDFVPVFFPGVFAEDDALPIDVQAGEVRGGVDLTVMLMAASHVTGRVVGDSEASAGTVEVMLASRSARASRSPVTVRAGRDGTFRFGNVTPGTYRLAARELSPERAASQLRPPAAGGIREDSGDCRSAVSDITVGGGVASTWTLALTPCLLVEGRIHLRGFVRTAVPLGGIRIALEPERTSDLLSFVPLRVPSVTTADGHFTLGEFGDVLPGRFVLRVDVPEGLRAGGWVLESATMDGRDVLDTPLEIASGASGRVRLDVTLTNERASLSGRLENPDGRPAPEFTVIAFTTNRDWWTAPFRRVRTARAATDGVYSFLDLPPGDYYLAALAGVAPDEWRDRVFLDAIVHAAIRVTLAPGEQKVQGLRIGGAPPARSRGNAGARRLP